MPVLNDFGDAGYARVTQQLDQRAAELGIPKEIIRQYWSDTAHLPQTLDELKAWGMQPDREYGQIRYDPTTGRWTPLAQGPTPGKTDLERGGFPHFINNNVGDAQRFQQVDASGNIFGGSWDPAYNAAHFDAQGRPIQVATSGFRAPMTAAGDGRQGLMGVDVNSPAYQAANPPDHPYGSYDPSAQTGGGAPPPPGPYTAPGAGAADPSGYVGYNPSLAEASSLAAFRNRELEQLRIPQFQFESDYSNRQLAQQNAQFQANLAQQADEIKARYGEAAAQRFLQEQLGRGNLALGGYSQAGQEALGRINAGIGAAQAVNQDQLGRGTLLAGLRGPANAFQQMKVAGYVAPNLAATLAGQAGVPGFQAPQGTPTPAGLGDVGVSAQSPADALLMQYAAQGLDPYDTPSAQGLLNLAGPNAQAATPGSSASVANSLIPGLSKQLAAAYESLKQRYPGTDPRALAEQAWQQTLPGLTPEQARQMNDEAHGYYAANGQNIPDELIRQRLSAVGYGTPPAGGTGQIAPTQHGGPALTYQGPPLAGVADDPNARQQIQGGGMQQSTMAMRMSPATQARLGVQTGVSPMGAAAPGFQAPRAVPTTGAPTSPMGAAAPDPAAIARQYTGGIAPNQINVANFRRLPQSAQQFTLGAYEAQGYDPNDVLETMGKALPRAIGPRRGFVAPAA